MSQFSRDPRGARDFSSPQVRVRGAGDFRHYSSQRLRLPNERPPLGPAARRLFGALLALAVVGGIGVGVYFGVAALLNEDAPPPAATTGTTEPEPSQSDQPAEAAAQPQPTQTEPAQPSAQQGGAVEAEPTAPAAQPEPETPTQTAPQDAPQNTPQEMSRPVAVSTLEPSVAEQPVTPAQIDGSAIVAERATAEPIPSGIPRTLADDASYDPTEPATVFTSLWPVGTTLRLTRLPGATLLTDEQQQQVIGSQTLVVVRATESSNTDLQMSPAAFERIAFYGVERVIAVRVEVTAPPP